MLARNGYLLLSLPVEPVISCCETHLRTPARWMVDKQQGNGSSEHDSSSVPDPSQLSDHRSRTPGDSHSQHHKEKHSRLVKQTAVLLA